jgi:hypothetical protein
MAFEAAFAAASPGAPFPSLLAHRPTAARRSRTRSKPNQRSRRPPPSKRPRRRHERMHHTREEEGVSGCLLACRPLTLTPSTAHVTTTPASPRTYCLMVCREGTRRTRREERSENTIQSVTVCDRSIARQHLEHALGRRQRQQERRNSNEANTNRISNNRRPSFAAPDPEIRMTLLGTRARVTAHSLFPVTEPSSFLRRKSGF